MASDYSVEILKAVEDYFRREDWHYEPVDENGVIRSGVNLESKLKNCRIFILLKPNGLSVLSTISISADEKCRNDVMEFITRANYGLGYGNFEMDINDGEIRFKTSLYCADTIPSYDQIRGIIIMNVTTLDRYGDGLVKVLFGVATPKEAVEESNN